VASVGGVEVGPLEAWWSPEDTEDLKELLSPMFTFPIDLLRAWEVPAELKEDFCADMLLMQAWWSPKDV
jgi:hypothetical protein